MHLCNPNNKVFTFWGDLDRHVKKQKTQRTRTFSQNSFFLEEVVAWLGRVDGNPCYSVVHPGGIPFLYGGQLKANDLLSSVDDMLELVLGAGRGNG